MGFWQWLTKSNSIEGKCVPRSFFNATAWAIKSHKPVFIADFLGHFQAVGYHKNELNFLEGNGWDVWPGEKEGNKPFVKLWTLTDAMNHFNIHNPWCTPSETELANLEQRVKGMNT